MASRIPQAPEAEAAVLGAVLLRNAAFDDDGVSELQPEDFHLQRHRVVWEAMRTLLHGGTEVDIVTLEDQLRVQNNLGLAGGMEGLMALSDRVLVSHNVSAHARLVAGTARARRVQVILSEAHDRLASIDVADLDDFLAETHSRLTVAEQGGTDDMVSMGEVVGVAVQEAKDRDEGTLKPFAWGLATLDELYDGGKLPGELHIVAARPGMGKTVLGMQDLFESGARGEEPLVFSLEMAKGQLGRRAIASRGEVNLKDAKHPPTDGSWQKMFEAHEFFRKMSAKVVTGRMDIDRLVSIARRWRRRARNPGPIVVDYLQLIAVHNRGRIDTVERISVITWELKMLAVELEVPIVLLAQLNRDCEKRDDKRPIMSDLKGSGSIEQDADSIVFLYRPRRYDPQADAKAAEINVAKMREGVPGMVKVVFEGHFSRFIDTSHDVKDEPGWRYGK